LSPDAEETQAKKLWRSMPTRLKVYRVMIGSPSDLSEERLAATAAVNEWNAQQA